VRSRPAKRNFWDREERPRLLHRPGRSEDLDPTPSQSSRARIRASSSNSSSSIRLPVYRVAFSAGPRELAWSASFEQSPRERFDFYNCPLTAPEGMHVGSFPMLPGKVNRARLFSRSRRPVVITATKDYGPTSTPLSNLGVSRTASGRVTWKLRLIRTR
jgi:hypothetical protein